MTRLRARELSPYTVTNQANYPLTDSFGDIVPGSTVTLITVTLWDLDTGDLSTSPMTGIINSRYQQDITAEVVMDELGNFRWTMAAEDNVIVTNRRQVERHRCTLHFEWTMASPEVDGETNVEFEIDVENLRKVGL